MTRQEAEDIVWSLLEKHSDVLKIAPFNADMTAPVDVFLQACERREAVRQQIVDALSPPPPAPVSHYRPDDF